MAQDQPIDFDAVLAAERRAGIPDKGRALGLAFSGGGIRSATFNLGVIQALAERGLLRRFDYLSTISGGGYIGSWLSLFIKRYANGDVAQAEKLLTTPDEHGLEHRAIRFLRAFSNYLTPRVGLSRDTLVAVATYLRNLLLNQAILVLLLGALLLLPRIAAGGAEALRAWNGFDRWFDLLLALLLAAPACAVALCLLYRPPSKGVHRPLFMRRWALVGLIDAPVLAAAFVAAAFYVLAAAGTPIARLEWFLSVLISYVVLWALGIVLAMLFLPAARAQVRQLVPQSREQVTWHLTFVAFAAIAGAIGGALVVGIAEAIRWLPAAHQPWVGLAFGPPAVIAAIMLMVVAHIGFMGRRFSEPDRELWSVFGARLMALTLGWVALFVIALYGAAALRWTADWIVGLGGAAWVFSTLWGIVAGRGRASGTQEANRAVELATRLSPYAFVLGLMLALSWGVHRVLEAVAPPAPSAPPSILFGTGFGDVAAQEYASIRLWFDPCWALPLMAAALFLAAALLSWRVNINLFSLHHFYRNRLARCYLGATNAERKPHALTGFDPEDDLPLAALAGQKPLHIVGTAINLNRGRQLAWQSRRAASFAFTPLHAGYEPASAQVNSGYRPSSEYGKDDQGRAMMLGTAVAISGAAASPNMGYHTSPAVAFLLTVFNVRLGHWCGDPGHPDAWRQRDPDFGLRYWYAELTGTADQDYPFVNLSDGGHFENLGIYELVRRRCSLIVASDAGEDSKYAFEDLAGAMRKCYTDFGVQIVFGKLDVEGIRPEGGKPGARHYAIAEILYPDGGKGTLLYWKSSLTADMPADIMHYKRTCEDFPHESTADQFFDEAQFESYRHLGYEVARRSIDAMTRDGTLPAALHP